MIENFENKFLIFWILKHLIEEENIWAEKHNNAKGPKEWHMSGWVFKKMTKDKFKSLLLEEKIYVYKLKIKKC